MTVNYEEEVPFSLKVPARELAERVIEGALSFTDFPYEAEVSLLITDNPGIQEINKEARGIDAPTDVLSFPMMSYEEPGNFSAWEEESFDSFNPDTGEAMLGDIVISADKVKEQAASYGHSQEREFAFLIAHSMFHLFGYDHMTEEEREVMEEKQRSLLEELNIPRS